VKPWFFGYSVGFPTAVGSTFYRLRQEFLPNRIMEGDFMRIRLSLTVFNDADLLSVRNIEDFDFKVWLKDSLRSYALTRQTVKTPLPPASVDSGLKNIMLSITLDDRKDAATIKWFKMLSKKCRAGAIKTVLRCSLVDPCLIAYYDDPADAQAEVQSAIKNNDTKNNGNEHFPQNSSYPQSIPSKPPEIIEPTDDFDIFNLDLEID